MILLNTTFLVHKSVEKDFVFWIHETYIPAAEKSGLFTDAILSRIMTQVDPEGTSYAVQMRGLALDSVTAWHDSEGDCLRSTAAGKWGEKVLHFTTYMEILNK